MLTRTLVPLTLLLALTGGAEPLTPTAATHLDGARAGHQARIADDVSGCREPVPSPVAVAPAACTEEAQP